jgi:ribosome-binding protein aMBF1 (putative translation factor)
MAMAWTVETLNETVDAELAELPADMRARLVRISELIESVDLPNVKEPHVRHVRGQLWEIRLKGKAGIARALRHGERPAGRDRQGVHQEDREDSHGRDRSGTPKGKGTEAMTKISELHRRWSKDRDYKDAYDALGEEFDLARALIEARTAAGLSQSQLARRMGTSQSYIARLEGGKVRPSTDALERFAQATRTRLRIAFEPQPAR